MRKCLYIIVVLCLLGVSCAYAETIVLRTGARIKGKIVLQNEEVVIVRDAEGARFQYPRAEVVEIVEDEAEEVTSPDSEISTNQVATTKKASILLELSAAPAIMVPMAVGGNANVDLLAGSHHIGDKHIFIGGGLGYHGYFIGGDVYNFLPIEAKLSMPLVEAKHAPFFGFALGYGIALSKDYVGGIYAGLDFGYRYQINPKSALALMVFASFQQARLNIIETIEGNEYINKSGRNFVTPGIKLALYF